MAPSPPCNHQKRAIAVRILVTHAREHRLFAGCLDRHRLGIGERAMVAALPVTDGDFRDWHAIDTWGAQIAGELSEATR